MSNETIADVRSALFEALRGLSDKANPMDIERAKVISEVSQTIINSAKVEIDYLKVAGGVGTGFIQQSPKVPELGDGVVEKGPGYTVRQHRLRG